MTVSYKVFKASSVLTKSFMKTCFLKPFAHMSFDLLFQIIFPLSRYNCESSRVERTTARPT